MSIVTIGSYDGFLAGWEFHRVDGVVKSKQTFGFKVQDTCIKTITVSPQFLALGGSEEYVKVYDLAKKREVSTLLDFSGPVVRVVLQDKKLYCASSDGYLTTYSINRDKIVIFNKTYVMKRIEDLAVDSTGKIALCIGKEGLSVINTLKATVVFQRKLKFAAEGVAWIGLNKYIAISEKDTVHIYNRKFEEIQTLKCGERDKVRTMSSLSDILVAGTEKGDVFSWNFAEKKEKQDAPKEPQHDENNEKPSEQNTSPEAGPETEKEVKEEEVEHKDDEKESSEVELHEEESKDIRMNEEADDEEEKMEEIEEEENDSSSEESVDDGSFPHTKKIKIADGRIRGVEMILIDDWVGYAVGFSSGKLCIVSRSGKVLMEMETGLRITTLSTSMLQ
ncbi:hypothetical protein EIN_056260 [Entamoeba invadens IP1]|uniref:hypothetical protein n=1 Tax=Entamoeba invadens IP1 TaxID=370355 RepID=UPI0002C3ED01|nr:hypothetical protein EIN_056260 [Entamoeba invadens IP1]ELP93251.1 hypothetical protein EIN_056260 [Entamoeba invadens IP1]|eukprot:XP_004260022.1 hypothetical protein EIN_056260 [Entamoeba invadens IP1]